MKRFLFIYSALLVFTAHASSDHLERKSTEFVEALASGDQNQVKAAATTEFLNAINCGDKNKVESVVKHYLNYIKPSKEQIKQSRAQIRQIKCKPQSKIIRTQLNIHVQNLQHCSRITPTTPSLLELSEAAQSYIKERDEKIKEQKRINHAAEELKNSIRKNHSSMTLHNTPKAISGTKKYISRFRCYLKIRHKEVFGPSESTKVLMSQLGLEE